LILSIAKYYTPKGKVIQETGITPNVEVASTDDLAVLPDEEDGGNNTEEPQKAAPKEDEQLHRAIEVLNKKKSST
jgi:C-terminal processing protease CtpA/Prc